MSMNNKKLFIFSGGHKFHVGIADAIGAEKYFITHLATKFKNPVYNLFSLMKEPLHIPNNYDIYITESCYYYPVIGKKLGHLNGLIINMNGGPILYWIIKKRFSRIQRLILLDLLKDVDGFIVVGKYGEEVLNQMNLNKPYMIVYPFIESTIYQNLSKLKPNLDTCNIMTIANIDWYYKGIDYLVESFNLVCDKYPNSNLFIVGKIDIPEKVIKKSRYPDKIHITGRVEDLNEIFKICSLYVQPSRGDIFSIAVLEALAAGIPAIVSEDTGSKEVIEKIDKSFVVPLNSEKLAKKMLEYFELTYESKKRISESGRKFASDFEKNKETYEVYHKDFNKFLETLIRK